MSGFGGSQPDHNFLRSSRTETLLLVPVVCRDELTRLQSAAALLLHA